MFAVSPLRQCSLKVRHTRHMGKRAGTRNTFLNHTSLKGTLRKVPPSLNTNREQVPPSTPASTHTLMFHTGPLPCCSLHKGHAAQPTRLPRECHFHVDVSIHPKLRNVGGRHNLQLHHYHFLLHTACAKWKSFHVTSCLQLLLKWTVSADSPLNAKTGKQLRQTSRAWWHTEWTPTKGHLLRGSVWKHCRHSFSMSRALST